MRRRSVDERAYVWRSVRADLPEAAVEVSEAGVAALRASYPARDDLGGAEPVQQAA